MLPIIGQQTLNDQILKAVQDVKQNGAKFFQIEVDEVFKGAKKGHTITLSFLLSNQRQCLQKLWSDKVEVIMEMKNYFNQIIYKD